MRKQEAQKGVLVECKRLEDCIRKSLEFKYHRKTISGRRIPKCTIDP